MDDGLKTKVEAPKAMEEQEQPNVKVTSKVTTFLTQERRREIAKALEKDRPRFNKARKDWIQRKMHNPDKLDPSEPAWVAYATTTPVEFYYSSKEDDAFKGKKQLLEREGFDFDIEDNNGAPVIKVYGDRLSVVFLKKPCAYVKKPGGGCTFCGLPSMNLGTHGMKINPKDQLAAMDKAFESIGDNVTVVEMLPDGASSNPAELDPSVFNSIASKLSKFPSVQRVAFETRPESAYPDAVAGFIENLRPDQNIDIYFGLETLDEWVNEEINNKGYGWDEFRDAVYKLKRGLPEEYWDRIEISVYNFMKPAYLTDREAFDATMRIIERAKDFSKEIGIKVDVKCEPAVVSGGSLQQFLFNESRYEVMSYFSVAEVIAAAAERGLEDYVKFGQRDDIDDFTTVAMIPSADDPKMFAPVDFMVYHAVQSFNTKKDVANFASLMNAASATEEFKLWEEKFSGGEGRSAISRLLAKYNFDEGVDSKVVDDQKLLWRLLDKIEYNEDFSRLVSEKGESSYPQLRKMIIDQFAGEKDVVEVKNFIFVDTGRSSDSRIETAFGESSDEAGVQAEIVVMTDGHPQNLWVKVPLVYAGEPSGPPTS